MIYDIATAAELTQAALLVLEGCVMSTHQGGVAGNVGEYVRVGIILGRESLMLVLCRGFPRPCYAHRPVRHFFLRRVCSS